LSYWRARKALERRRMGQPEQEDQHDYLEGM